MDNFISRPDGPSVRRPGSHLDPAAIRLSVLIAEGFVRDMRRCATSADVAVILSHLANGAADVERAWQAALAEIRSKEDDGS